MFKDIYRGKKVLVTGHTGFKGSWLCYWLESMGANVLGFSDDYFSELSHIKFLTMKCESVFADIRDRKKIEETVSEFQPEAVFHLAAQSLVRSSYAEPVATFETNIMGTINLFEACRKTNSVRAIVNVTSDKAYENKEWEWGYRECDPMGGHDPYSASKGAAEIVAASYQRSFFDKENILLANCRAGNVIGGGDWAEDRIIPDIVRAASKGEILQIRNPGAIRPWQHVLEPLSGYLMICQKLLEGNIELAGAWNFGPSEEMIFTVGELFDSFKESWGKINCDQNVSSTQLHEAQVLKLDCSKALMRLRWKPVWGMDKTLKNTVEWYKNFYEKNQVSTPLDLKTYVNDARELGLDWAN